ncbi:PTS sugar transporter subunit IIC [Erysipelothrix sp. HDW6C]|uniref:PTS sugar transporter subunit IIC n=1 Tax=Erysipelothrix sp. HDW6C TaxID=2714930 RepID=UPI00140ADAC9|nr:PTS transporter subunit EIIC [Erysipelothrix sp. HDW6C]QIK70285.1 PTS sugar transporter subunit IIC [Erysipelothrix sp. HDW6C]
MFKKLENILLPFADKLAANRYLSAIRDGFIAILPIMIVGSFFVLINNVFIGPNGFTNKLFGQEFSKLTELGAAIVPAVMSIMAILLTFTTAKALSETYNEDTSILPTIAVVSLMIVTPFVFNPDMGIEYINTFYTGSAALFLAFVTAIVTVELVRFFSKFKPLIIRMPDTVPSNIARSFNKLIPVLFTVLIFGCVRLITNEFGSPLNDLFFNLIQAPFTRIVSSPIGLIIIYVLYMLLWGLGIHTAFIFNPILEPIYLSSLTANEAAHAAGTAMNQIITKPFLDSVAFMGGAGNMLALIIAIFIVSRRQDYKSIAKLGAVPSLFNISEPIMFGLPVVMNPILIIPMILVTLAGLGIGVLATSVGFMGHSYILIPWTTPPILGAYLTTGGDIGAAATAFLILIVSVVIYMPFVMIMNKESNVKDAS